MGWSELIAALVAFFALHAIPVQRPVKARLVGMIGARGFTILFSVISVGVLIWLIGAAGRAPFVEFWPLTPATRHISLSFMALAISVLCLGVARPNPLSFGGARNESFDPERAGIVGWTRHPLLVAIGLWSLAHLIANGDLAHGIVFGLFAVFCIVGMRMIDRRKRRELGSDWDRLTQTKLRIQITPNGMIRTLLAIALYAAILALHGPVIGAYPLG